VKQDAISHQAVPFVATTFLGERAREALKEEGVGYLDAAGNFYLKQGSIFYAKEVARNPFSKNPPLKNLFAPISSRITRALLVEPKRTWQVMELALATGMSLGQTYNVINGLLEEEFILKESGGIIKLKDPSVLMDAWKKVYPTYEKQRYLFYSDERSYSGILSTILKKAYGTVPFAFGFFTGAGFIAPFIRGLAKAQLYVENTEDVEKLKNLLNLYPVNSGPNVELFLPYDIGVFYMKQTLSDPTLGSIPVVSSVQLYMDLFDNPSRGEEQADHLRSVELKY
jgi:hypothetical protein